MNAPAWQISRNGALWLLVAFTLVVLPMALYLPPWVPGLALVAMAWRVGIYRGRLGAPGRWLNVALVLVTVAGLFASFKRLYGLEPMAAMMVCAYGLKLLEMTARRDALVVIFLGYFVALSLALFDQGMGAALYIAVAVTANTAALVGLHQSREDRRHLRPVTLAMRLFTQALPLMLVFFLVMPRLGPLWSVPTPGGAVTGMSDHLALGDIAQLGRSSETAFRVTFASPPPPRQELYWRGLTLSHFDGKTWSQSEGWGYSLPLVQWFGEAPTPWQAAVDERGEAVNYRITLERQSGNWLYSLWLPQPRTPKTGLLPDFNLVSQGAVGRRMEYEVQSLPDAKLNNDAMSAIRRRVELQLPATGNERTRALAAQWAAQSHSPRQLIERLLSYYRASFYYTLSPGALGQNSIDDFLFNTKTGFCEHFAASFVFFMRSAGIPARIVAGYQGGEFHPQEGHLTVRQYDAHAWAEVWLDGEGWLRVDPTAAVAPERILSSLLDMMPGESVFADSPFEISRYRHLPWLNNLRLQMESLDYQWAKWVLGYQNVQSDVLRGLLGGLDSVRLGLFLLGAAALALTPVLLPLLLARDKKKIAPEDACYTAFCQRLARAGCPRLVGEAPLVFAHRAGLRFPQQREQIHAITARYLALRYGGDGSGDWRELKKQVQKFRLRA